MGKTCQVRIKETSESEPLMTCRKGLVDIRTGAAKLSWEKSKGSLLTAWSVSGIQAA